MFEGGAQRASSTGRTVLVIGAGPVGLLLMMLAAQAGGITYASDPMAERRGRRSQLGARETFDPMREVDVDGGDARSDERTRCGCGVGGGSVSEIGGEALAAARPGGRVLLFAQNDPQMRIEFAAAAVGVDEKEILGSYSADVDMQDESARLVFFARAACGTIDYAPISAGAVFARGWRWRRIRRENL